MIQLSNEQLNNLAKGSVAQKAYGMITEIMHIDNIFDDRPVSNRKKQRQLVLSEKVDAYFAWAKQKYAQVTHNNTIGKALPYSINQEYYLRVFLSDGHVPMDNNYAEQAIRPFTIGRICEHGKHFRVLQPAAHRDSTTHGG